MPQAGLSEGQLATLSQLCDTVVPALDREPDPDGFWARKASDVGADLALADLLSALPPADLEGIGQLLDELAEAGFGTASQRSREQILRNFALAGPDVAAAVAALVNGA